MSTGQTHKPIIGLLGGIGSGKSLVIRQLASLGCGIVDADVLAHQVLQELEVVRQLEQWWGPGVRLAGGGVDRQALGRIVFANPAELARLEGLIHPRIHEARARLRRQFQEDPAIRAVVEDTPLLLEKGLAGECDVLVFVQASREVRLQRLAQRRGWGAEQLALREKAQMPLDIKAGQADYVVDNNVGEAECLAQVRRVLSQILQAHRPGNG